MTINRHDGGFSLLEVLVAIAIAGIVLSAIIGFRWTFQSLEIRERDRTAAISEVLSFRQVFQTVIQAAVLAAPRPSSSLDQEGFAVLSYGPAGMLTVAPMRFTFRIQRSSNNSSSIIAEWDEQGRAQSEVLVKNARSVSFSYFERTSDGRLVWTNRHSGDVLAFLVRVDHPLLGAPLDILAKPLRRSEEFCAVVPHFASCAGSES